MINIALHNKNSDDSSDNKKDDLDLRSKIEKKKNQYLELQLMFQ